MSVGVGDSYLSISNNSGHRTDRVIGKQLFHTDLDMANKVTCLHSIIMTIPGIGSIHDTW